MKKKLFSILPLIALGSCATKVDVEPMVETPEIEQQIQTVESTSSVIPSWYKELPEDDPKQRCPNIEIANKELGWQPSFDREVGLKKTIEYFDELLKKEKLK